MDMTRPSADDPRLKKGQLALLVAVQPQVGPDVHAGEVELRRGKVANEIAAHALRPADRVVARAVRRAGACGVEVKVNAPSSWMENKYMNMW